MNLTELKQQFLSNLEIERGRSAKTIENYDHYLTSFLTCTKVTDPTKVTDAVVQKFSDWLAEHPGSRHGHHAESMKPQTQNYHLIALRSFLKFLQSRDISSLNYKRITLRTVPSRPLDVISPTELNRLIQSVDTSSQIGRRDRAILLVMFSTGLRVSELCALSIRDIDLMSDEFLVTGKRGLTRNVFFSNEAKTAVADSLKHRTDRSDALFIQYGKNSKGTSDLRLSPRSIERIVKTCAVKAGITTKVTPHVLRHSFATALMSHGVELRDVQVLLGHTVIGTTKMYERRDQSAHT